MKLLPIVLFFYACNTAKQPVDMGEGDTLNVKVDSSFTIKLSTSMGTGYSWGLADSAWTKNISLDSVSVINNVEGKDDGADTQVFHFKAIRKSSTPLHFIRKRPWQSNDKADKEKKITVIIE